MDFLPLFHNLRQRPCLLVGGGETALRKLRALLEAGATVTLVAPEIKPAIVELAQTARLHLVQRGFRRRDLRKPVLVIAATNNHRLNARISRLAQARRIPVNVVDSPELCSAIFPSIVDRSPLQIALSSGGAAPVLVRHLRGKLESLIPAGYGDVARLAEKFRSRVKDQLEGGNARRQFWEQVLEGRVAELVLRQRPQEAETALIELLQQSRSGQSGGPAVGEVYLVGGGPGDPDLLTFKALRLMQQADIVLYDRLVSKPVLNLVRRDAEQVYVGKTAGDHPVTQENINRKLAEYAREGKRVLRLKGGDPFIFGRGGEEIEYLAEQGIPFQVVPGITAASGCASYAGIPLTHRDHAQSVRFITGHRKGDRLELDWQQLASPGQTLVFYMGLNGLETICRELIEHGMNADTPAALVEKGTSPRQRVFVGTLETLPGRVRAGDARAPTLIIVGTVVTLHNKLGWFGEDNAGVPAPLH